jgi:hypothetical protein
VGLPPRHQTHPLRPRQPVLLLPLIQPAATGTPVPIVSMVSTVSIVSIVSTTASLRVVVIVSPVPIVSTAPRMLDTTSLQVVVIAPGMLEVLILGVEAVVPPAARDGCVRAVCAGWGDCTMYTGPRGPCSAVRANLYNRKDPENRYALYMGDCIDKFDNSECAGQVIIDKSRGYSNCRAAV